MPHPTCRPRAIGAGNPASASLYRERNLIERFFSKLKHFRRIATRYDKLAATFLAIVQLASMRLWLRAYESMTLVICPALCHFRTHTVQRPRPTIRKRGPDGKAATCFRVPRPRSFSVDFYVSGCNRVISFDNRRGNASRYAVPGSDDVIPPPPA